MLEIPSSRNDWRLDIVSILAILGESNIRLNSHLITASPTCLLPRLLPAPQALIGEDHALQLPCEDDALVVGSISLTKQRGLNFFPNLLHGTGAGLPPFSVREFSLEANKTDMRKYERRALGLEQIIIEHRPFGTMSIVAIASAFISLGLMIWSILIRDGIGLIGIILMSLSSTLMCMGYWWAPDLPKIRKPKGSDNRPPGDVVVRSRTGTFTIIHCDENTARSLYFNPSERKYYFQSSYLLSRRIFGAVLGGLFLTAAIVFFSNCTWPLQVGLAVAYTMLNVSYWVATVLPPDWSWDLSGLKLEEINPFPVQCTSYTEALWLAIRVSRSTKWVFPSQAVGETAVWKEWVSQADEVIRGNEEGQANWNAVNELDRLLEIHGENM